MAHNKNRPRRLGSVRHSIGSISDSFTKFPPLLMEKNYELQGSAIAVPPINESPDGFEHRPFKMNGFPRSNVSSRCDNSQASSAKSEELEDLQKQHKEALGREQKLKETVDFLKQLVEELQATVREKEHKILELHDTLKIQEAHYKQLYESEVSAHSDTKDDMKSLQEELEKLQQRLTDQQKQHVRECMEAKLESEKRLAVLEEEKRKEITIRDEKLGRLKAQMAAAMQGNSWERQQQLDELTKELARTQEECDMFKMKMKAIQRTLNQQPKGDSGASYGCGNCANLSLKLNQSEKSVTEKNNMIKELKSLCSRFEKQLSQQDVLLKKWAESKGYKS